MGYGAFLNKAQGLAGFMHNRGEGSGCGSERDWGGVGQCGEQMQERSTSLNPLFSACRASVHAARCFWSEWVGDGDEGPRGALV